MKIYTIGFTKKNAEKFFRLLKGSGATTLVDVRLNNNSQLAGFTKRDDLKFFLKELLDMDYRHELSLAPTKEFLDAYKKGGWPWNKYEEQYLKLIASRGVENRFIREDLDNSVLLCSEPTEEHCHRRLAAEYFAETWSDVFIEHL